ncbi:MAG: hypothetical protein K6E53_14975 [Lachnospiraceae bacterium]|nr:hypothetical protein [Lachnospiraceae bacterium]
MFTAKDIKLIDTDYFSIIDQNESTLTLLSNNSGLYWNILSKGAGNIENIIIYRMPYMDSDRYLHGYAINLEQAFVFIHNYDQFQLQKKSP